jgi:hypothetical protein
MSVKLNRLPKPEELGKFKLQRENHTLSGIRTQNPWVSSW